MNGVPSVPFDDERAAALARLRAAAEEGRLDPRVLDARVELVRAATSRTDLDAALHGVTAGRGVVPAPASGYPQAPGYHPDDPLRLTGGASSTRRDGAWVVPPYLRLHALVSSVRLDCLDATAATDILAVSVLPGTAGVRVVLPPGWAVDADRLGRGIGSVKVSVPSRPDPGCPLLVVRGSVGAGSFKATGPSSRERRRRGWT